MAESGAGKGKKKAVAAKTSKTSKTGIPRTSKLFRYTREFQQEEARHRYRNFVYQYSRKYYGMTWTEEHRKAAYQRTRTDPTFQVLYQREKYYSKRAEEGREIDRDPSGSWARTLVDLGMRERNDYWDVGDTPTIGGKVTIR